MKVFASFCRCRSHSSFSRHLADLTTFDLQPHECEENGALPTATAKQATESRGSSLVGSPLWGAQQHPINFSDAQRQLNQAIKVTCKVLSSVFFLPPLTAMFREMLMLTRTPGDGWSRNKLLSY